jgi:hypothetical protein
MFAGELDRSIRLYEQAPKLRAFTVARVEDQGTIEEVDRFCDAVLGDELTEAIANLGDGLDQWQVRAKLAAAGRATTWRDWPAISLAYRTTHEGGQR